MTSIIVPAHNEQGVLDRCLRSLLGEVESDDEIIVVCNGCTDDTEAIARRFMPRVIVKSIAQASKTLALNLGDQAATQFPRVYIDADVVVERGALARLVGALAQDRYLAASLTPRMDFRRSNWAVRAYYRTWLSLPYCRAGMLGAGTYALSKAGRARFSSFPDLISDDGFVRANFEESERANISGAYAIVRAPSNLRWLLKIKTRSRLGQLELKQHYPHLVVNERKDYRGAIRRLLRNPANWAPAVVYAYVALATRRRARRLLAEKGRFGWDKDESSREVA